MKKVAFVMSILLIGYTGLSQTTNNEKIDKVAIGFNLGLNYSNVYSNATLPSNIEISNGFGYRIGVLMDYSICKNLSFSPKAELSFNAGKVLSANTNDNSVYTYKILPHTLEFAPHFLLKTGEGNLKPYLLVGPSFKFPVSDRALKPTEFDSRPDFAIDLGFGLEKRVSNFIFAPEVRYSFGVLNVNRSPMVKSLYFHNISLIFSFKS